MTKRRGILATAETGFDDVALPVRDAKHAGFDELASFFEEVMSKDSERARRCHDFLGKLQASAQGSRNSIGPQGPLLR